MPDNPTDNAQVELLEESKQFDLKAREIVRAAPAPMAPVIAAALREAAQQARDRAFRDGADIARAIDSGRGNESEIANALEGRQGTRPIERATPETPAPAKE